MDGEPSRGPELVADVFKFLASVILVFGLLGAAVTGIELGRNSTLSTGSIVGTSVGIAVGAVVAAATVAFFGYVLDLLMEIRDAVEEQAGQIGG